MPLLTTPAGTRLFYDEFGDVSHPPLLLIQGLGAQRLGWRPEFCRQLASEGFRVMRFDNRDVGESDRFVGESYTIADMADDSAGLLDALGISSAHVVGQSMGGMIAQELAIRHPDRLLSLCLLYTSPSTEYILEVAVDRSDTTVAPTTRDEAMDLYVINEAPCASRDYPQDVEWLRALGAEMFEHDPIQDGMPRQMDAVMRSRDRTELVRDIVAPTLVVAGDSDRLIDPEASRRLHELIHGSTLHLFPGMGHEVPPALFGEIAHLIAANAATASTAPYA